MSQDREKRLASQARYEAANRDKRQCYQREYRKKNRERRRVAAAEYRRNHPDRRKTSQAAWYRNNKDRHAQIVSAWRRANPRRWREYCRLFQSIRRRKTRRGKFSAGLIDLLLAEQGGRCPYCQTPITDKFHIDHYIPVAADGPHDEKNIQLTCSSCNLRKGKKDPMVFLAEVFPLPRAA